MAGEPLLKVDGLSVNFHLSRGVLRAVKNVSFDLARGETLAILGESGSGKSVSALAVMGLIDSPPGDIAGGRILLDGEDITRASATRRSQINGCRVSIVFQDPLSSLNPVFPVGWQIAEMFRIHGRHGQNRMGEAVALLDRVGIPDARRRAGDYPHQFSGGQRQRIMIAMAIALTPDLLIADEPTTALDVTVQAEILALLKEMQKQSGMGLLMITHDLAVVAETAERVVVMRGGQIVEAGGVEEVFSAPAHPYTRNLLASVPGRGGFPTPESVRPPEVILSARNLVRAFGSLQAVRDVSVDVRRGETVGIVGESGSGKSTLARLLLGIDIPNAGKVEFRRVDIARHTKAERLDFRRRMQVIFQDPGSSFNPYMTVYQILTEPWIIHRGVMPKEKWRAEAERLLEVVGLSPGHIDRFPHQFSGGQRQRIAIARALALHPELIVCDEALSSLDVSLQAQVLTLLKDLRREFHLSFVFIAHDLPLVRDFCDRVHVMYQGQVVEEGNVADVFDHPQAAYTRKLLRASAASDPILHHQATEQA
jgi:peptide/nickel transport system ATP-binding protein